MFNIKQSIKYDPEELNMLSELDIMYKDRQFKTSELKFPNDKDFLSTDWRSQKMFDIEGLEERILWCANNEV